MFNKVLIANRAEIAVRVIRACKEMGIKTVAVYSDADENCLHVKYADESINIGPPLARKSYLDINKIIDVATRVEAEAIHPGYGFLAESTLFARACEERGIKLIGPSSETQELTGDKISSRKTAVKVGVPVSPGSEEAVSTEESLGIAEAIGYPVIIKASGGGGGKGMRIAYHKEELLGLMKLSRGEAGSAFGNPALYVEKYIEEPRHIEVQILADEHGNYVHLGERECSIQRNFQKLIEECPSCFVDDELRSRLGQAAIAVARSVNYVNAGTVEFLVDRNKNFYFNEINARLQVEHPVTEMVTGIDLVKEQIKIASGGRLELPQDKIPLRGWSIECRINAEDPENAFMPAPGIIDRLILPGGPGVRVDTHLYFGYAVPPFYDSLIAKLVVWDENRDAAIMRMRRALDEFQIDGLKTTISFHKQVMQDESFVRGDINTHFLSRLLSRGCSNG